MRGRCGRNQRLVPRRVPQVGGPVIRPNWDHPAAIAPPGIPVCNHSPTADRAGFYRRRCTMPPSKWPNGRRRQNDRNDDHRRVRTHRPVQPPGSVRRLAATQARHRAGDSRRCRITHRRIISRSQAIEAGPPVKAAQHRCRRADCRLSRHQVSHIACRLNGWASPSGG